MCVFRSRRRGFLHYVRGQITVIAKVLYNTEVNIEVLDQETENNMEHVIMRLHFDNNQYTMVSGASNISAEPRHSC
jgi:guanylate cyclase